MADMYRPEWNPTHCAQIEAYLSGMLRQISGVSDLKSGSVAAYRNYKVSFLFDNQMCNIHFVPDGDGLLHKGILPHSHFIEVWMTHLNEAVPPELYQAWCDTFPQAAHGVKIDEAGVAAIDRGCYWEVVTEDDLATAAA